MKTRRYAITVVIVIFTSIMQVFYNPVLYDQKKTQRAIKDNTVFHQSSPTSIGRHKNLVLLACETRPTKKQMFAWNFTANMVRELASGDPLVNVTVKNLCDGIQWKGFRTKFIHVTDFLNQTFGDDDERGKETKSDNIVIFTDSDAFFNPWGVSAREAIENFHKARNGKEILIGAESACWIGKVCTREKVESLYPNATRSQCPQFLNSGMYMGFAKSLLNMMQSDVVSRWKLNREGYDDQLSLTRWYSYNKHNAELDTNASLFRNLNTGQVDARPHMVSDRLAYTCGGGDAAKNCTRFEQPYWGSVNKTTRKVEMVPLPGCTVSKHPFVIHGNGDTKHKSRSLILDLLASYAKPRYAGGVLHD